MSSSSSTASLPHFHSSFDNFIFSSCTNSTVAAFSLTGFTVSSVLLVLPLCIHVIYVAFRRRRQQRAGVTMSHSDLFTYHMVAIELMNIVGVTLCSSGVITDLREMTELSSYVMVINMNGQQAFHVLTCVERYLAVVHPVTYLGLRNAKGIRIRNIIIGCAWLQCISSAVFISMGVTYTTHILSYLSLAFMFAIICFCSLSVLRILIRPGPGEGGGARQRIDQSKLRAIYTITAIMAVLLFRIGGTMLVAFLYATEQEMNKCLAWLLLTWFSLPSSLVLPLLFLHRAGKLTCRNNNASGQGSD